MVSSVGVFCAASESIDPLYFRCAAEVGNLIGSMGLTLVYGGAAAGLMEATAAAAKKSVLPSREDAFFFYFFSSPLALAVR